VEYRLPAVAGHIYERKKETGVALIQKVGIIILIFI
jgi:predicted class III extradiol MEMO1 family dioxygenase